MPARDEGNPCTQDVCQEATGCTFSPVSDVCDDGEICTIYDERQNSVCVGQPDGCDDGNACTADSCLASVGCQHASDDAASCSNGGGCTALDRCEAGACVGAPVVCRTPQQRVTTATIARPTRASRRWAESMSVSSGRSATTGSRSTATTTTATSAAARTLTPWRRRADRVEQLCGTEPLERTSTPTKHDGDDLDGDGLPRCVDPDDDADGWTDALEEACAGDPRDPSDVPGDADADGVCDAMETKSKPPVTGRVGLGRVLRQSRRRRAGRVGSVAPGPAGARVAATPGCSTPRLTDPATAGRVGARMPEPRSDVCPQDEAAATLPVPLPEVVVTLVCQVERRAWRFGSSWPPASRTRQPASSLSRSAAWAEPWLDGLGWRAALGATEGTALHPRAHAFRRSSTARSRSQRAPSACSSPMALSSQTLRCGSPVRSMRPSSRLASADSQGICSSSHWAIAA